MKYEYETLDGAMQFELSHPMADPALTQHPETGEAIRRVITGGCGFSMNKVKSHAKLQPHDFMDSKFAGQMDRKGRLPLHN